MTTTGDIELIDTRVSSMHTPLHTRPTRSRDSRWSPHTLPRLTPHAAWARQAPGKPTVAPAMDPSVMYSLLGFINPDGKGDKLTMILLSFNIIDRLQTIQDPHVMRFYEGRGALSDRLKGAVSGTILLLCPDDENDKHALGRFIKNILFRGEPDIKAVGRLRDLRCTGVKKGACKVPRCRLAWLLLLAWLCASYL